MRVATLLPLAAALFVAVPTTTHLGVREAAASVAVEMTLADVLARADRVVVATPLDTRSVWEREDGARSLRIATYTRLRVERSLPAAYLPGQALTVAVDATPSDHTLAYALVESPPVGWVVRNVSHEGRWDAANHQVKWGPYFDQTARHLTYDAVPGPSAQGVAEFGGRGSFDGYGIPAGGPLTVWPPGKTPSPRLAAAVVASGVNVQFRGEPGRHYELQSSEDLGTWNMGPTVTLDAKGSGSAPTDAQMGARFFRLRPLD